MKTSHIESGIAQGAAKGWSSLKIARELDVDRETVRRYRPTPDAKRAIVLAGLSAQRIYQDLVTAGQFAGS